jgi:phosphomannomutase
LTDYLDSNEVAGLINCTASHNPPEWQGIKFNPRLGYPAPTNLTDFIAARTNELQLLDESAQIADLAESENRGLLLGFDPITHYTEWMLNSGKGNSRIPLDWERIRDYFFGRLIFVDEMYGAGRGYLTKLLGEIGVQHTVLHGERDPNIPGLDYANPEEPFINSLKDKVRETGAAVGLGLDTDADRFGIVDKNGVYFRPNQILPMLVRYLGVDRGFTGRVIATQTGSPLNEILAGKIPNNCESEPLAGTIPAYVAHPFYQLRVGRREDRSQKHTFLVPVGIKYIEEVRRVDRAYQPLKPLPERWRDTILIGGEESSGLTTRGHVTDKDGIWADLLVLDMLAYYGTHEENKLDSLDAIWKNTTALDGCWVSYGGSEDEGSNSGRVDIDAVLEAKEGLIDFYLDFVTGKGTSTNKTIAGLDIIFLGGIRYDVVEIQLRDSKGDDRHFMRIRASGTEPINRVYVESSDPDIARQLVQTVLNTLKDLSVAEVKKAHSEWRLVEVLSTTPPSKELCDAVTAAIARSQDWKQDSIVSKLKRALPTLERRSQHMVNRWIEALGNG